MDGHEVIGPDAVPLVVGWFALVLTIRLFLMEKGGLPLRGALWLWGSGQVGVLLWLATVDPDRWWLAVGMIPAALFSWAMGRAVIERVA